MSNYFDKDEIKAAFNKNAVDFKWHLVGCLMAFIVGVTMRLFGFIGGGADNE